MYKPEFKNMNVEELSSKEAQDISGGCTDWFCLGPIYEAAGAVSNFFSMIGDAYMQGSQQIKRPQTISMAD